MAFDTDRPLSNLPINDRLTVIEPCRPKKVLHIFNSAAGGAALSTIALIEALRDKGIGACAVCHDAGSVAEREQIREATHGDVLFTPMYWWNPKIRAALWKRPLIEFRQRLRTGGTRRSAAKVARFALNHEADLIHTNTILVPEGGLAARRLSLPHVWHLRELLGPAQPFQLPKRLASDAGYFFRHASLIVANSEITAEAATDSIPADLVRVVPNGLDLRRFSPPTGPRLPGRPLVVAMVASLTSRWKKHGLFVEAAARIPTGDSVEFRIYGHDPLCAAHDTYAQSIHQQVARLGLSDRFRFAGYVGDPAKIMSEVDILVHPADQESFGRVIVEAMATAVPVVGVRGGGVAEIVVDGETGFLAPPDNVAALAELTTRLIGDAALRRRLGSAGRRRAETTYSLESCAEGILQVYEEAMHRPLGTRRQAPRS